MTWTSEKRMAFTGRVICVAYGGRKPTGREAIARQDGLVCYSAKVAVSQFLSDRCLSLVMKKPKPTATGISVLDGA